MGRGYRIVLTADRATMTDYSGLEALGFLLCIPYRLVPEPIARKLLAPKIRTSKAGEAIIAPYALRKIEASLLVSGFEKSDIVVTTPEALSRVIGPDTRIVAIHVLDPLGLAPVSYTVSSLMGGGDTWTKKFFLELISKIRKLKERYRFKVIAGGPGTWQLRYIFKNLGIDCLIHGEGEVVFPEICRLVLEDKEIPDEVDGGSVPLELIPTIRAPARAGLVQITRGCPRRCQFCNPTMFNFRSIPLDQIVEEIKVNKLAGFDHMGLVTEDGFMYGARGVSVNRDAIMKLIEIIKNQGVNADFTHVSISGVLQGKDIIPIYNEAFNHGPENPYFVQVGLESGSSRIIAKYMAGKPRPWKPEDWPWMVLEATEIMNENYWYQCYTLILGLPGEDEYDVVKTLELIKSMRRAKCWIFPLLFIPMGRSMLEHESFAPVKIFEKECYRELLFTCIEHNLEFSKKVLPLMLRGIRNSLTRRAVTKFLMMSIKAIERTKYEIKSNIYSVIERLSQVKFISPIDVFRALVMMRVLIR